MTASVVGASAASALSRYAVVTLAAVREITGLDLVSARETDSDQGRSYHQMEAESESKSHQSAREEGIGFFRSIGYKVFPEGVGVRGIYTMADFLAIRENRTVFVEVLSDTNVKAETLNRKAQLQQHGELCFVLFSGIKRSNDAHLMAAKRAIESWADVLYCRLDGYGGNTIEPTYRATVAYDTTRQNGIRVALAFERSGRMLAVSAKFLTHLYRNPHNTLISYPVSPVSYCYEEVFLEVFRTLAWRAGNTIKFTSSRENVTAFRAMRRKSGLKMIDAGGHVSARLKSEYRGAPVEENFNWTYHPSTRDLPPDDIFGVFVLEKTGPNGLCNLITTMEAYGLTLDYSRAEHDLNLRLLVKQRTSGQ